MARKKRPQNSLHNKFHSVIAQSHRFRAEEGEGADEAPGFEGPEEERGARPSRYPKPRYSEREQYNINRADAEQSVKSKPGQAAKDLAYYKTRSQRFLPPSSAGGPAGPSVAELDEEFARPRVRRQDVELIQRGEREAKWKTKENIYRVPSKDKKSVNSFVEQEVRNTAPTHYKWIKDQFNNPESDFNRGIDPTQKKTGKYTSGQRRRQQIYTDALQQGATHEEAYERVRRARLRESVGRPAERVREARTDQARKVIGPGRPSGRDTRYASVAPDFRGFKFGVDTQRRPSLDEVKKLYPGRPEQELLQIQQAGTELLSQELLTHQKWAHETRRANLLGKKTGKVKEDPDKVTIFTTNVGHPAVSVPADSLVGQYLIRKRKSVLTNYGVPASQLRGKFPDAVRDAHVVDVSMGTSYGVQGRQGLFSNTGYRFGKRASSGYGRPKPLGAQVLYDTSTGRPLYDTQGNIRYTEGATRPIDWTTPNFGARILIG